MSIQQSYSYSSSSSSSAGGGGGLSFGSSGSTIRPREISIRKGGGGGGMSISQTSMSRSGGGGGGFGMGGGGGGMSLKMRVAALGGSGGGISGAVREVASNPTAVIAQREREKRDLQDLNDRFASYIERVRFLEADNKRLQSIIDTLKVKFEQLEVTLKEMYEAELAAARKTIDETTKAKAEVELRVARLEEELADYRMKYETEVREHLITKERVPALEKGISERDAQIEFLTKTVDAQERELAKIKGDLARCQMELRDAKTGADAEIVARIELESIVQTKDDEINFLKNMYEEKIRQLMDINFDSEDWRTMFSNELALALRDIRAEYDAILESQKGADTDSWYKAKFNEMLATSQRSGSELTESKEEVKRARAKYQELQMEISRLRGENAQLLERLAYLEAELDALNKSHALALDDAQAEIEKLRAQLAAQILELKELMDSKLALDAEIATYRRLLMGEESRLREHAGGELQMSMGGGGGGGGGYSMSMSGGGGGGGGMYVQSSSSSASASAGGASQQVMVTKSEVASKKTYQRSSKGPVAITECCPDGEFVLLENKKGKDQSLDGFCVRRKVDFDADLVFKFPAGFVIPSGSTVKVWADVNNAVDNAPFQVVWGGCRSWGVGSNILTTLVSPEGEDKSTHKQTTVTETA
uniref:Intermediate filament protein IF1 n=1 Tax=Parasagitta elegans TaxID=1562708 RepID=O97344_9BILA|nr:intermediate filament protein IF1 [Parasagitta elegans]